LQRDLGEAGLGAGIGAADVRVYAGEPDLFDVLAGEWLAPHVVAEVTAAFVDRDGVAAVGHVGIACGVGEFQRVPDPAYGADGVP